MGIYYEYNCGDSQDFLLEQFENVFKTFGDELNVMFVPFGKAQVKFISRITKNVLEIINNGIITRKLFFVT